MDLMDLIDSIDSIDSIETPGAQRRQIQTGRSLSLHLPASNFQVMIACPVK
jgi:hypothetical protein